MSAQQLHRQPPGPGGQLSLSPGNGVEIPQFDMLLQLQEEYGDTFQYKTVAGPLYVFSHPGSVRSVFSNHKILRTPLLSLALGGGVLAADDEHWKRQRKLMLPEFRRSRVAAFTGLIAETTRQHARRWQSEIESGSPIDIVEAMSRLTLSVVSRSMFSIDLEQDTDRFLDAYAFAIEYLGDLANATAFNAPMMISPSTNSRFQKSLETMNAVVYSIINERRASASRREDLLSVLLECRNAESGEPLTDVQVRDEVITMLLAGHETTSLVLTWVWYLLGRHPRVEARLRSDIEAACGGRLVEYADLAALPYSRMIVDETMRLYPPVAAIYRQAEADVTIAGYRVTSGTGIVVSPFLTHRHPDFWESPFDFVPERFDQSRNEKRHAYSYFPFGAGRHTCLGKHFAVIESQVILITVMQLFQMRLADAGEAEPYLTLTLRPRNGLRGYLEPVTGGCSG